MRKATGKWGAHNECRDCHNDCPVHELQGGHREVAVALDIEALLPFQGWGKMANTILAELQKQCSSDMEDVGSITQGHHKSRYEHLS